MMKKQSKLQSTLESTLQSTLQSTPCRAQFTSNLSKLRLSKLAVAVFTALGLGDPVRPQVVIEDGQTFTIINGSQYRGQSFIINPGGTLINNDIGTEIGGVDLKLGGTLDLQQALHIGVDAGLSAGLSILTGTVTSIDGANLIVEDNASITGTNAGLVSAVLIRNGAQLTLSATGAIGAPADFDFGPIQVETASGLVIDADNAIDVNREIRVEDTARLTLNANQSVANLYSEDLSEIVLAEGKTLTINTTGTMAESDLLFGNIVGQGNLVFAGNGFLYMIPDMESDSPDGPGGQTNFTGTTTVNGGGTLTLGRQGGLGGSTRLAISNGSSVVLDTVDSIYGVQFPPESIPPADNALNTAINVDLDSSTHTAAALDVRVNQTIDSLNMGTGATLTIANDKTLSIGSAGGNSTIRGVVTGAGDLTMTGSGTTRVENAMALTGEIRVTKTHGHLVLATPGALGTNPTVNLSGSKGLTLTLDTENAWNRQTALSLPATATLEINASQTIDNFQAPVSKVPGVGAAAGSIVLANGAVLTVGQLGVSRTLAGNISGDGSLTVAAGTTSIANDPNPNTFTGNVTVKNSATLSLPGVGALGGAATLVVEAGGTVNATASLGNPFHEAMNVQIRSNGPASPGRLNIQSTNDGTPGQGTFVVNSVTLDADGEINLNSGDALYIGSANGDSLLAGSVSGVSTFLSIGGSGTTTLESALNFSGELQIADTARVVIKAADAIDVRNTFGALNVDVGAGTTLDLEVADALATISQAGFTIAKGTRVNVNATDAISPSGSFTFADGQSVLAFNDVTQTLSGQLGGQLGAQFSGQFIGAGQLLATGAAQLTLSGDNPGFTGVTRLQDASVLTITGSSALGESQLQVLDQARVNVNADYTVNGAMRVDGQFGGTGSVILSGTEARLSGVGSFANPVVLGQGATHAPGNSVGTQTFVNYALDGGATLESEFEISNNELIFDQVVVTGDGQIGQNGTPTIEVIGLPTNWFYGSGTRYELITTQGSGELTITNLPVLQTTFLSPMVLLRLGGDTRAIWLETSHRSYASIQTSQLSVNEFNAATALDQVYASGADWSNPAVRSFFEKLDDYASAALNVAATDAATGSDIATYQAALDQVSGQRLLSQDSAYWLAAQGWNNRLASYLQDARLAGPTQPVHVAIYGGWANNQTSTLRSGFKTDTYGLILAGERPLRESQYVGFALGYENNQTSFNQYGGSSKVDSARLALSYAYEPEGHWDWRASLMGGYSWLSSERPQPLFQTTANGSSTAWDAGFLVEAGYKVLQQAGTDLRVLAGMQAIYGERQAFDETGAVTTLNVASRTRTATQSRLGFALKHDFVAGKQAWSVDTRAYWLYDFGGNPTNLTATYAMGGPNAQSFELVDSGFTKSSVWLDVGVSAEFNTQFSGRLSYQGQFGGNYSAQTISAELLMRF